MRDVNAPLRELYGWTLRTERELTEMKGVFFPMLRVDYGRLIASLSALRVTLEMTGMGEQVHPQTPYAPPTGPVRPSPDLPC
jgi:hypothetical protein